MASLGRAMSLPPGGNPFWSENAQVEWELTQRRPEWLPSGGGRSGDGVPIPSDDDDLEEPRPVQGAGEEAPRGRVERTRLGRFHRSRSGGRRQGGDVEVGTEDFKTPPSVLTAAEQRGKGRSQWRDGRDGLPERRQENQEPSGTKVQDDLERAMEKEVFNMLFEENQELRKTVNKLMEQQSSVGSWSEISGDGGRGPHPPPPPPPQSASPECGGGQREERYTPNGTKVPPGPPPVPIKEVPAFPFPEWTYLQKVYEGADQRGPCKMSMGDTMRAQRNEEGLHPGYWDRGIQSRGGEKGLRGGVHPRQGVQERSAEPGGGMESRHARGGLQDDLQIREDMVKMREKWLSEEMAEFKQVLHRYSKEQGGNRLSANYWQVPFGETQNNQDSQGVCHGDRAPEHPGVCHGDRAPEHPGVCHGDRAPEHPGECHGDRASEHREVRHGDHQGICHGGRALGHQGECHGEQKGESYSKASEGHTGESVPGHIEKVYWTVRCLLAMRKGLVEVVE